MGEQLLVMWLVLCLGLTESDKEPVLYINVFLCVVEKTSYQGFWREEFERELRIRGQRILSFPRKEFPVSLYLSLRSPVKDSVWILKGIHSVSKTMRWWNRCSFGLQRSGHSVASDSVKFLPFSISSETTNQNLSSILSFPNFLPFPLMCLLFRWKQTLWTSDATCRLILEIDLLDWHLHERGSFPSLAWPQDVFVAFSSLLPKTVFLHLYIKIIFFSSHPHFPFY